MNNNEDEIKNFIVKKIKDFFGKINLDNLINKNIGDLKLLNKMSTEIKISELKFNKILDISRQKCFKCRLKLLEHLNSNIQRNITPIKCLHNNDCYLNSLANTPIKNLTPEINHNKNKIKLNNKTNNNSVKTQNISNSIKINNIKKIDNLKKTHHFKSITPDKSLFKNNQLLLSSKNKNLIEKKNNNKNYIKKSLDKNKEIIKKSPIKNSDDNIIKHNKAHTPDLNNRNKKILSSNNNFNTNNINFNKNILFHKKKETLNYSTLNKNKNLYEQNKNIHKRIQTKNLEPKIFEKVILNNEKKKEKTYLEIYNQKLHNKEINNINNNLKYLHNNILLKNNKKDIQNSFEKNNKKYEYLTNNYDKQNIINNNSQQINNIYNFVNNNTPLLKMI